LKLKWSKTIAVITSSVPLKMDMELVNKIKRLAIIALASDEQLIETIVLKGGNAIDLAYKGNFDTISRTSYDLDFSIEDGDFNEDELTIAERIKKVLMETFLENDYVVLDYKFLHKPKKIREDVADFWGGYLVTFKIIEKSKYDLFKNDLDKQRKNSVALKPDHSPVFELEFSKFECDSKEVALSEPINYKGNLSYGECRCEGIGRITNNS
jgi:hypothetical protein